MDYTAYGLDFHAIRNRNEARVLELMPEILAEHPDFVPTRTDIEDIYALTLNLLPARYVQSVALILNEPVSDDVVRLRLREAIHIVRLRPNS